MKEIVGVVGGMGSHAAVCFFQQLINKSQVEKDQSYMEILIHNNTRIPDRTQGILYGGEDPLPELLRSVTLLEQCGASTIVLACITAYYFSEKLQASLKKAKILDIVKETVDYTYNSYPNVDCVGIIASSGAIKANLWQNEFDKRGIKTTALPEQYQEEYFNDVIYGSIKVGHIDDTSKWKILKACDILVSMGAEVLIGGCSELPLIISKEDMLFPYIDSINVIIEKLISQYYRDIQK